MTSLLRRKRQITVRSTPKATETNSPLGCLRRFRTPAIIAAITTLSILAATVAAYAASTNDAWGNGEIKKVGYSTIKSSGKLKWLPYRPQPGGVEEDATRTEQVVRWTSSASTNDSRQASQSAFNDSFGNKQSSASAESVEEVNTHLVLQSAGPGAGTIMPNIPTRAKLKADNSQGPNFTDSMLGEMPNGRNPDMKDDCPTVKDLKKISQLSTNISPSAGDLPKDCPWGGEDFQPRSWASVTFTWTASGLCHHPLYFEEIQVERYGHTLGPWLQPFASGAHFFLTLPILPYKMGLELPNECMYTLGYYRPGSCAPYMIDPLPLSIRAGLFEAGAWVGGAAIIP